jgi:hypothetical protein
MIKFYTLIAFLCLQIIAIAQAPFGNGNIVVFRNGDGTAAPGNTATAVFLVEYTPTGTLVQTIAMPTTLSAPNYRLVSVGNSSTEGQINLSADGQFLLVPGYDANVGTSNLGTSVVATVKRVVGTIKFDGTVNTTTGLDAHSGGAFRSVASADGNNFYTAGGNLGQYYGALGSTGAVTLISNTITNTRSIKIFEGNLYISNASGSNNRVGQIGAGLPTTTGNTAVGLTGLPTSGSPQSFLMLDLDAAIAGVDVLYIADDAAGILKYSKNAGGTWVANGTNTSGTSGIRGITGKKLADGSVQLYFTTFTTLYALNDASGYNATITSTAGTSIATSAATPANANFKGVAFAPQSMSTMPVILQNFNATYANNSTLLQFKLTNNSLPLKFDIEKSLDGLNFNTLTTLPAQTSVYQYQTTDNNLQQGRNYYRLKMYSTSGEVKYSQVIFVYHGIRGFDVSNPTPTITNSTVNIQLASSVSAQTNFVVNGLNGKAAIKFSKIIPAGNNTLQIPVQNLQAGNYFITVSQGQNKKSVRFIKI